MSDDLGIDLTVNDKEFGLPKEVAEAPKKRTRKKKDPVVDIRLDDPAVDPKADWVEIVIDSVTDLPSYEVVSVNGKVYQIPRDIPTLVPPSVVEVLNNARASRSVAVPNPLTGHDELKKQHYNAIPWRKV